MSSKIQRETIAYLICNVFYKRRGAIDLNLY